MTFQPHLLPHLTRQSLHIQGCRNRDRKASWLRPNATPYQAVGPSAQNCSPYLEVQRAFWKAGINKSSMKGNDLNSSLEFPLRIKTETPSLLQTPFPTECTPQVYASCTERLMVQVNSTTTRMLCLWQHSPLLPRCCSWTKGPFSLWADSPPTFFRRLTDSISSGSLISSFLLPCTLFVVLSPQIFHNFKIYVLSLIFFISSFTKKILLNSTTGIRKTTGILNSFSNHICHLSDSQARITYLE
jgi:hypothetical protein